MAYVGSPFDHDIFVSYSHGADGSGESFLQPWSAAFTKELERELRTEPKYREDLRIFLDADHRPGSGVDPMAPLTKQLSDQIGSSALLLVLMSPDYLRSKWCADERDWWCARQIELGLPSEERIAVVRIWPTDQTWPQSLIDSRGEQLPGFVFFRQSEGLPARPIGWTDLPGAFGSDFRKALLDIVGRLYSRLDAMKGRLDERHRSEANAAKLALAGGQSIYLHGRVDHKEAWEQAGIELTSNGFSVVPGEPDSVESDPKKLQAVRERRVEALSECDALLILGTDDTRALDADLVVVGKHDRQSARARSQRLLPCGLLDTVGARIATPVRKATARNLMADWIDGTQPPWTPAIRQWLVEKSGQQGVTV
jgi:hypothetical protein